MSIYRIYGDDARCLNFVIPTKEVIEKLGREYPIHIKRKPQSYREIWDDSFELDFYYGKNNKGKTLPDLIENNGRMYFNEAAYQALYRLVGSCGEFLPIVHKDGKGYLFNPLKTAEEVNGINEKLTAYDENENLTNFGFLEDNLKDIAIFRTELDAYMGIFCNEAFKDIVEKNKLTGVYFGVDVSNPTGEPFDTLQ
jgi:hypothetical protein